MCTSRTCRLQAPCRLHSTFRRTQRMRINFLSNALEWVSLIVMWYSTRPPLELSELSHTVPLQFYMAVVIVAADTQSNRSVWPSSSSPPTQSLIALYGDFVYLRTHEKTEKYWKSLLLTSTSCMPGTITHAVSRRIWISIAVETNRQQHTNEG